MPCFGRACVAAAALISAYSTLSPASRAGASVSDAQVDDSSFGWSIIWTDSDGHTVQESLVIDDGSAPVGSIIFGQTTITLTPSVDDLALTTDLPFGQPPQLIAEGVDPAGIDLLYPIATPLDSNELTSLPIDGLLDFGDGQGGVSTWDGAMTVWNGIVPAPGITFLFAGMAALRLSGSRRRR